MIYNVVFKCEFGQLKMESCNKFITQNDIEGIAADLEGAGAGKLQQIIIDVK